MAKKIIVLSDGTGNAASSFWRTNVWRTFQALDLSGNSQVARYDDGVGSSSFLPLALLGGAFGYGLKRNVIDLYKFVCRNYAEGDEIYAFGFSRGAFTVRVLVGLIVKQGLVRFTSEKELHRLAVDAYRAYRAAGYNTVWRIEVPLRWIRDQWFKLVRRARGVRLYNPDSNHRPNVAFVGVWDTVSAYGLPIEEMTRGVGRWLWPLELPNRELSGKVDRACHALAIDDERTTFHPLLWTEAELGAVAPGQGMQPAKERITQVWFLGMHANVGGGYPDDALAHIPLRWMLEQVKDKLKFKEPPQTQIDEVKQLASIGDKDGRMYDSRFGLGICYRYGPRRISEFCHVTSRDPREAVAIDRPKIHCSVFERMRSKSSGYAPLGLPASYDVVAQDGKILAMDAQPYEVRARASERARLQEIAWNYVWLGRGFYFAMLAALIYLIAFSWFHDRKSEHEYRSPIRLVSEFFRLWEAVLPSGARWWTDWYAANPEWFVLAVALIVVFITLGSLAKRTAAAHMRLMWEPAHNIESVSLTGWHKLLFCVRTSRLYMATIGFLKRKLVPFLFAALFLWLIVGWGSHLVFNIADSTGVFCKEKRGPTRPLNYDNATSRVIRFSTNDPCARTGLWVEAKQRYAISFEVTQPWKDGRLELDPKGRESWQAPTLRDEILWRLLSPFRRVFFRGWFHPIARVGATGTAEYFLDPYKRGNVFIGEFRTERSGELFIYVNDAVLPLPYLYDFFYRRNGGEALIKVTRFCDAGCKERTLKMRKEQCRSKCTAATTVASGKRSDNGDWTQCYVLCVE
jgi:uncharacterized protein (DUF2235 family)